MEKINRILIITGGILLLFFGTFHSFLWILFDWGNDLPKLTIENSNIMQMLNIGLISFLFSFGFIFLRYRRLFYNPLGRALLFVAALFFGIRLITEFVFPDGSLALGVVLFITTLVYLVPAIFIREK